MSNNVRVTNNPGANGADYIADTIDRDNGRWQAITALEASTVEIAAANWMPPVATVPLPAGVTIHGDFTSIKLTSGTVVAYRSV